MKVVHQTNRIKAFIFFSSHSILQAYDKDCTVDGAKLPEDHCEIVKNMKTWSHIAFSINAGLLIVFEAANVAIFLNVLSHWT
jgi:hypothetical protein